jgi:hypothetical protein
MVADSATVDDIPICHQATVHAFYFNVLQLILGLYSTYLMMMAAAA